VVTDRLIHTTNNMHRRIEVLVKTLGRRNISKVIVCVQCNEYIYTICTYSGFTIHERSNAVPHISEICFLSNLGQDYCLKERGST
jgi:hypothetical protein